MTEETLLQIGRESVFVAMQVAAPMLVCGLVAGLAISLLQAVTQVQEATLSFIPKIIAVGAAFLIAMPWMIDKMVQFTNVLMGDFRVFIR